MTPKIDLANWQSLPDFFLLSVAQTAQILNCSPNHVRNAIHAEEIDAHQLRGKGKGVFRIEKRAVVDYLKRSKVNVAPRHPVQLARANGKLFKHIEPTWLHGPSQRRGRRSDRSSGRNARSS